MIDDKHHIEVVRIGEDPFGRNESTVFYRNRLIGDGKEVFYLWLKHWPSDWPSVAICPKEPRS